MSVQADFVVYDALGHAKTIIEVKAKRKTSDEWASQLRRNLFAHGFSITPKYFMLITLDRIYLWKNGERGADLASMPVWAVKADSIWKRYAPKGELSGAFIDGRTFELIVHNWLRDVSNSEEYHSDESLPHEMLEAIHGSKIVSESRFY